MDLSTNYLGLSLSNPLMPGASPLTDDPDTVRSLEDAGAAAIVMPSLFEEEIVASQMRSVREIEVPENTYAEALTYLSLTDSMRLGPDLYLEKLTRIKESVAIPVIGSLNGITEGGWMEYAGLMEETGIDGLELNLYMLAADPEIGSAGVEEKLLGVVRAVRQAVSIPIAVKLSPFFSSLPNFCANIRREGADGVLLFNRFYQPDIDVENLDLVRKLVLSTSDELLLRLRWLALLADRTDGLSLGVTGGVHTGIDVVKAIMAGADAVQVVSALYKKGPAHLGKLKEELQIWLESHEYESLAQMHGSMATEEVPDAGPLERINYIRVLQGGPA